MNLRASFKAAGFQCLTSSKYLSGSSYLVAGDVLLNDAHHTATAVTNGKNSGSGAVEEEYDMPTLKKGSQGKAVEVLQVILGGLDVDGSFGPLTLAAVKAFQKRNGIQSDGVVGSATWKALFNTL